VTKATETWRSVPTFPRPRRHVTAQPHQIPQGMRPASAFHRLSLTNLVLQMGLSNSYTWPGFSYSLPLLRNTAIRLVFHRPCVCTFLYLDDDCNNGSQKDKRLSSTAPPLPVYKPQALSLHVCLLTRSY
jgi:hypothetical protein